MTDYLVPPGVGTRLPNVTEVLMAHSLTDGNTMPRVIRTPGGVYVWPEPYQLLTLYTTAGTEDEGVIVSTRHLVHMYFGERR